MSETSSAAIYRQLRLQIIDGAYGPTQFLVEREIAEAFGVSRAPVRDALQRLCQEGYLIAYPRKGHLVNTVSGEHLIQIQQVRFQLESLALALVVANASDAELAQYPLVSTEKSKTNPYRTDNTRFHLGLARLSRNEVLEKGIYQYLGDCSLAVFQHPELVHERSNFHQEILDALRKRDFPQAQLYLAKDLQLPGWQKAETLLPMGLP